MNPKTCLVTGATSGLGKAAALALGSLGWNLFLVGRHAVRGERVAARIRAQAGANAGQVLFLRADISSRDEVKTLARTVLDRCAHLDVLINNAGARFDDYGESAEGFERTFATNHLGPFLLTGLLLDRLLAAPQGRIINVSSISHAAAVATGEWQLKGAGYDRRMAYAKSKLANILFSVELASRLTGTRVTVNAVDPGVVITRFARNNGWISWLRHLAAHAWRRELVWPRQGAETIVHLATTPEVDTLSGKLFRQKREVPPAPVGQDREAGRQLWNLSVALTGVDPGQKRSL